MASMERRNEQHANAISTYILAWDELGKISILIFKTGGHKAFPVDCYTVSSTVENKLRAAQQKGWMKRKKNVAIWPLFHPFTFILEHEKSKAGREKSAKC